MSGKRHSSVHIKHMYLIYFVENPAMLIWLEKLTQFFSTWRMWLEKLICIMICIFFHSWKIDQTNQTFHIIWWLKIEKFFPQYNIYFQQFMFFFSSKKRSCLFFLWRYFTIYSAHLKKAQLFSVSILLSRSQTASSNSSAIWSYAKPQSHNRQNLKIISAYYLYLKFV